MLKALEIVGFKSFADKTRFEFPAGITVIVGPNGSGKSNIVDAMKWVLGEQSAKSLRGKDMADVIFKGSGNSGRKPMNTAEATIIFDNSGGQLPFDAPEVHVTRRVYRSGEGEYLINRQPCRLKDIRDLFRGTGVGVDAYSLIEQGKVDRLLQASAKDRRAIFEEAAGISRFKAKKIEAQRRIERVDQNLLRLRDIVEEVENRLKTVRAQASKAARYREYSERLQQLRTQVGLVDWRALSVKLQAVTTLLTQVREEAATLAAQLEKHEARALELETELTTAGEDLRNCEGRYARNREQIAGLESQIEYQRKRLVELEDETRQLRLNIANMSTRVVDSLAKLRDTADQLLTAEADHGQVAAAVKSLEQALAELTTRFDALKKASDAHRHEHAAALRTQAILGGQVSTLEMQLTAASQTVERCRTKAEELVAAVEKLEHDLDRLRGNELAVIQSMAERAVVIEEATKELDENRRLFDRRQADLTETQSKLRAVKARGGLLEELENKLEGLASGVKDVLRAVQEDPSGPLAEIRGVAADLLHAPVEYAAMIDAALGSAAQHLVVSGDEFIAAISVGDVELSGRIALMPLTSDVRRQPASSVDLTGRSGVLGRAADVVEASSEYNDLVQRLLGETWLVEQLTHALLLQAKHPGLKFVTRAGEVVMPDGTLHVGSGGAGIGLVSRRSELRAIKFELVAIGNQIQAQQEELARIGAEIDVQNKHVQSLNEQQRHDEKGLAEQRFHIREAEKQREQLARQQAANATDETLALAQQEELKRQLALRQQELADTEIAVAQFEEQLLTDEQALQTMTAERDARVRDVTAERVSLAKSEQRLEALRVRLTQLQEDQRERERASSDARSQLAQSLERAVQSERAILLATSQVAELYLKKEAFARETHAVVALQQTLLAERQSSGDEIAKLRRQGRKLAESQHEQELAENELRHERQTLADRLRDDYAIEIEKLEAAQQSPTEASSDGDNRTEVEEEIAALRRKISNIGAVNMDALSELDDLEARFGSLSGQYNDLTQAKESLERIIAKINNDSRRLFIETLEAIRTNFQALYRKAFGGGKADIVLEEGVDILECGVEIIATPPGKPSFNNSLLSGGEKALTAVALLLAIFQFRPSPFCVLDEVDAPFDEANIGRFVDVLRDFLGWTKFVIVTHSKKTMTAATTLYGVTMQESGVSKRVSVRFEDVSEDGHISEEAVERAKDAEENAA